MSGPPACGPVPSIRRRSPRTPETGVVAVDEARCTGCGECVVACPYGGHGVRSRRSSRGEVRPVRGPARTGADTGLRQRLPDHRDSLRGTRRTTWRRSRGKGRGAVEHDHFLMGPATVYLPPARARGERAAAPKLIALMADHFEPRSARDRDARGALRGGSRRAHGGPDRAGGLQRLLQRLPGEVPRQGRTRSSVSPATTRTPPSRAGSVRNRR